jgi:hypothetical protein
MHFPMAKGEAAAQLAPLLAAARASAFGKGGATVVDPTVRVARELKPEEFTLAGVDLTSILEQVSPAQRRLGGFRQQAADGGCRYWCWHRIYPTLCSPRRLAHRLPHRLPLVTPSSCLCHCGSPRCSRTACLTVSLS